MNGLRLYGRMIALSIRGQMQYRASFAMVTIGNALGAFIEFLGIWAFFGRFGSLSGWTFAEAGMFFGMGNIAFALCEMFMREFDMFSRQVRTGEFDRILLRPRSTVLQMLGAQCQLLRLGRLLQGAVVLGVSLVGMQVAWGLDRWLLLVLSILGGALMFSAMIVLQATSCFWTIESLEVWNCITYGGVQAIQYPVDIYQKPLRFFFSYIVPLAAMNYWPSAYLLGRGYVSPWLSWLSPAIGLACFLGALCIWHFGVRHYRSAGS